jgi:hypothetical protein
MAYRIVPKPLLVTSPMTILYGPGRANFGYHAYDEQVWSSTLPDDPAASPSFVQVVGTHGLQDAYARLARTGTA